MTRGKHARSTLHKANEELAERCTALESEVERLRSVENVAALHVEALGRIETLTAKLLELDGIEREFERTRHMLDQRGERLDELQASMDKLQKAHDKMAKALLRFKPADAPLWSWLLTQFEGGGAVKVVVSAGGHGDRMQLLADQLGVDVKQLPPAILRPA